MREIKRCPFCDEELEVVGNGHYYAHKTNGCILQHLCFETDDEEAIGHWNTRKQMQEIVERLEEDCKIHRKDKEEAYLTDDFKLYQSYSDVNDGLESAIRIVKEVGGMNESFGNL